MTEASNEETSAAETATADETDWKAEARKWEQRAKENGSKARDLEKKQQSTMSDAERAVVEAEERGRTAASSEFGKELARTRFDALAGRRNPDFDTDKALEFVDLSRFLGDDGRPDTSAITAAVERLIPEVEKKAPSFDGGSRTTAAGKGDMNSIIRKAAGLG